MPPVIQSRLNGLFKEWAHLTASHTNTAVSAPTPVSRGLFHVDGAAPDVANPVNVLFFGVGTGSGTINLRGGGILQYLCDVGQYPEDIAIFFARSKPDAPLSECTAIFFSKDTSYTIATPAADTDNVKFTLLNPTDPTFSVQISTALQQIGIPDGSDGVNAPLPVATVSKIEYEGFDNGQTTKLLTSTLSDLEGSKKAIMINTSATIGALLQVKDELALKAVCTAAQLGQMVMRRVVIPCLEQELTSVNQPTSCSKMSADLEQDLKNPNSIPGLESLQEVSKFGIVGAPVVLPPQSYSESIVTTDSSTITVDIPIDKASVVVRYGCHKSGQASFFARTLFSMEHPNKARVMEAYAFVKNVCTFAMDALQIGKKVSSIYEATMEHAVGLNASFAAKLHRSFGYLTGPVILEASASITEKGTLIVRSGMSFIIRVIFLGAIDEQLPPIEIADLVLPEAISEGRLGKKVLRAPIDFGDVCIGSIPSDEGDNPSGSRRLAAVTRGAKAGNQQSNAEKRSIIQENLWEEKRNSFSSGGGRKTHIDPIEKLLCSSQLCRGTISSYSNISKIPTALLSKKPGTPVVDPAAETAWLPMQDGKMAPFHVSTINRCDIKPEGATGYSMTVIFAADQESNLAFRYNRNKIFVKELTYDSTSSTVFDQFAKQVVTVKKTITERDARRKNEHGVAKSTGLGVGGAKIAELQRVKIRPSLAVGRKGGETSGTLEAYHNGFKFTVLGHPAIEILYENVKHCICQPSYKDIFVIFHISLHRPILMGRRNISELQAVAEVLLSSEAVSGGHVSNEDDLQRERMEEERVRKTNLYFKDFARKIQSQVEDINSKLSFPTSSLDFDGTVGKSTVRFRGDKKTIWAISEPPFVVARLDEVEIVALERLVDTSKDFDMSLVPISYKTPFCQIFSIEKKHLVQIQDWLCGSMMVYLELTLNPNYNQLFKAYAADPNWNPWDDEGWCQLKGDDNDEEDGDADSDSDFDNSEDDSDSGDDDSEWDSDETSVQTAEDESGSEWSEMSDDDSESDESVQPARKRGRADMR